MYIIRKKRPNPNEHPYIPELKYLYTQKRISRREFLRNATMLGVSLASATAFLAACSTEEAPTEAPPPPATEAAATKAPTAVPEPTKPAGPTRGGELILAHEVQDLTNPHGSQWTGFNITMNVAEYMVDYDQNGVYQPRLVESWDVSDDVKTWTFNVRQGVKFNHGPELTADDIIFNLVRWLDPEVGCPLTATLVKYMTENDIERVDDYTVKVHCNQPYAGLLAQLSGGTFAPHIVSKDWEGDWLKQPVGTGPFTLEEFTLDERAVLKRRDGYWRNGADGSPLPYLDSIRFVYLGTEQATRVAALKTGEIHHMSITPQSVELVGGTDIVVNAKNSAFAYVYKMRSDEEGAFNDVRLRQAVKACQDRQQILDTVWKGYGSLGQDHHVAPIHNVYCPMDNATAGP